MPSISPPAAPTTAATTTPANKPHHQSAFREFLSELNPLQYIPVIGTLYRAATGDTIPEAARTAGSLVVSFLTGGPIGAAINIGAVAIEKATGIDPEKIGQRALAAIGIGAAPTHAAAVPHQAVAAATPTAPTLAAPHAAWSPAQLAAYGVTTTASGTLQRGDTQGADVLNDLELARHHPVLVA
jgi:hypothetical protein